MPQESLPSLQSTLLYHHVQNIPSPVRHVPTPRLRLQQNIPLCKSHSLQASGDYSSQEVEIVPLVPPAPTRSSKTPSELYRSYHILPQRR
jgi:hypothetical protein